MTTILLNIRYFDDDESKIITLCNKQ